jgi:hypothetical protein
LHFKIAGETGCGKNQKVAIPVCVFRRESILPGGLNAGEIPRSVRNDKTKDFFSSPESRATPASNGNSVPFCEPPV